MLSLSSSLLILLFPFLVEEEEDSPVVHYVLVCSCSHLPLAGRRALTCAFLFV